MARPFKDVWNKNFWRKKASQRDELGERAREIVPTDWRIIDGIGFFKKSSREISIKKRRELLLEEGKSLGLKRGCELLGVNRSTFYYKKRSCPEDNVELMNWIRDIWSQKPFYGYRRITWELREVYQVRVNHKRVQRLMRQMGIEAFYPAPKTSFKDERHEVYPYLLEGLLIERVNQVWMVDITYLKLGREFVYFVATIDVYSRYVVGWSLGRTLNTENCLIALKKGFQAAKPEIVNSDQGCQFTSELWRNFLIEQQIKISMNGKGRCMDNIYIERFWRTIKYEAIYLNEYGDAEELNHGIEAYMDFYNHRRFHQSLNYKTPASVYFRI